MRRLDLSDNPALLGTETAAVTSTADADVRDRVAAYAAAARELNATLVLDASYDTDDQEQLDTVRLDTVLRNTTLCSKCYL